MARALWKDPRNFVRPFPYIKVRRIQRPDPRDVGKPARWSFFGMATLRVRFCFACASELQMHRAVTARDPVPPTALLVAFVVKILTSRRSLGHRIIRRKTSQISVADSRGGVRPLQFCFARGIRKVLLNQRVNGGCISPANLKRVRGIQHAVFFKL